MITTMTKITNRNVVIKRWVQDVAPEEQPKDYDIYNITYKTL